MLQKTVQSVLNKHKKRDSWFLDDYSVNPYEGCSCNCQYCYVRGSKYGENMEEKLAVKINSPSILEKQLKNRAVKNQYGFITVGSATDAYIHHESEWKITRAFLEIILKYRFPVFLSTKCSLIRRDFDLLKQIDEQAILPPDLKETLARGVILSTSVSHLDNIIASMLEPRALLPGERLELLSEFRKEGFLAGVNAMPILPYISDGDHALELLVRSAKEAGADYLLGSGLTLFGEGPADSKTLYFKFLERYDASLIPKYQGMYENNSFPPSHFENGLRKKIASLCEKYKIRNSILSIP